MIKARSHLSGTAFALALAAVFFVQPAYADSIWTDAQNNNDWNNNGNWSGNFLPDASSKVIVRGVPQARIFAGNTGAADTLHVGDGSSGDLAVFGSLNSNNGTIGYGTTGIVTIDGGHWTLNSSLIVGTSSGSNNGAGNLVLKNGGKISANGSVTLGTWTSLAGGSGGGLHIGAQSGQTAAAPGIVDATSIETGVNDHGTVGTVQFNHTSTDYWFTRNGLSTGTAIAINGDNQVIVTAGQTAFKTVNTYKGGTTLNGGTLAVTDNNQLGDLAGALHFNGGTIKITPTNGSVGDFFGNRVLTWGTNGGGFDVNGLLDVNTALSGGTLRMVGGSVTLHEAANLTGIEFSTGLDPVPHLQLEKSSTIGNLQMEGGWLQWSGISNTLTATSLNGTDANLLGSNLSIGSGNYGGQINLGALTKTGSSTLSLVGASHSQYVTAVNVNSGTLHLTGRLEEGTSSEFGNISVSGSSSLLEVDRIGTTKANNLTLDNGGRLRLSGTGVVLAAADDVGNALNVSNGQIVLSQDAELQSSHSDLVLGSSGSLAIGAASGDEAAAAGVLTFGSGHKISGTGTVTFNHTGSAAFSASLTGGVSVSKSGSGTTTLGGTQSYTGSTFVSQGTLIVNANIASSLLTTASGNGAVGGTGTVGALKITSGGVLSPGNSPGTLSAGNTTWESGGNYHWEINNVSGTEGINWDYLAVSGTLDLSTISSVTPFTIKLISLDQDNHPGSIFNFDSSQDYTWVIAAAENGIEGFDVSKFTFDASGFMDVPDPNHFLVSSDGNILSLSYSAAAVPEPTSIALLAIAGLLAVFVRRTRVGRLG